MIPWLEATMSRSALCVLILCLAFTLPAATADLPDKRAFEIADYYLVHLDWFHQWLGGEAPPWDVEQFLRNQAFIEPPIEDGRLGPHSTIE